MAAETVDLTFLVQQQKLLLQELQALRQETRQVRAAFSNISEHFTRQERRLTDLREDVETMIKLEIGGAIANLETRFETNLAEQTNRLEAAIRRLEPSPPRSE